MRTALLLVCLAAFLLDTMPMRIALGCACEDQGAACCASVTPCADGVREGVVEGNCCSKVVADNRGEETLKLVRSCGCGRSHGVLVRSRLPVLADHEAGWEKLLRRDPDSVPQRPRGVPQEWRRSPELPPPRWSC